MISSVVPSSLLDEVVDAVAAAWPSDDQEGRRALDEVVRLISHDGEEGLGDRSRSDRLLVRRLLSAMRLETLRLWGERQDESRAREYLDLLLSLERLSAEILPQDGRDFSSRLADPDGFELLVEVAHDLRSPLTSVTFLAESLRGGFSGEVDELQKHQLGLIYSAALGMSALVSDMVELARQGTEMVEGPPEPFSLEGLFDSVGQMLRPMAESKSVELHFEPGEPDRVLGWRIALSRVLLNLATNGLKFTEEGYVRLRAERIDRERVRFSVRDTGRGIPEEQLPTLYQPFKKSRDRGGHFFSGAGLGLSIARRLLLMMDSELELETEQGWGTRFSFTLSLPPVTHL